MGQSTKKSQLNNSTGLEITAAEAMYRQHRQNNPMYAILFSFFAYFKYFFFLPPVQNTSKHAMRSEKEEFNKWLQEIDSVQEEIMFLSPTPPPTSPAPSLLALF